ncbi:hypothetical protein LIER_21396 [Lithospermum erythrorhizon]|uniref:Uncharacterized protein n=1 Tax=Lithospermum erythrorhizon TaxID=34254 RepID=A0AAV3QR32_LITER
MTRIGTSSPDTSPDQTWDPECTNYRDLHRALDIARSSPEKPTVPFRYLHQGLHQGLQPPDTSSDCLSTAAVNNSDSRHIQQKRQLNQVDLISSGERYCHICIKCSPRS